MNEKTCKNCRYYGEYICMVPIWEDGKQHRGQLVHEDQPACAMFEAKPGKGIGLKPENLKALRDILNTMEL